MAKSFNSLPTGKFTAPAKPVTAKPKAPQSERGRTTKMPAYARPKYRDAYGDSDEY